MTHQNARIVVCGAGIAGISAAYQLAVVQGCEHVTLVEEGNPLSMTSDKSTEAYRNWWPGPDATITAFMNRSIDMIEGLARETGNRFMMNQRGYLFASAEGEKIDWLFEMATRAAEHGAGPVRVHDTGSRSYRPSPSAGIELPLSGADIITDRATIREFFPYLAPETRVVAHARRAGWLSAQQLGMTMLEAARSKGVEMVKGRVRGVSTEGGQLGGVSVETSGGLRKLDADRLILASGPMTKSLSAELGLNLPIAAERHYKISISDSLGLVPRDAPMMIWLDEQNLPWSEEEKAELTADASTRWLTETFPSGVHGRPDGSGTGTTFLILFNYENHESEVVFPLPEPEFYGEIALRGMTRIVPALQAYVERGVRPYIDGGYYIKTRENRPLIGPTSIPGVFMSCAYSGFGIMSSCAGGDLVARHVLELDLPAYAPAFLLSRYQEPQYVAMLDRWGDGGQL